MGHIAVQQQLESDTHEPDVWWGQDGIDALLWADPPRPYAEPLADTDPQNTPLPAGGSQ